MVTSCRRSFFPIALEQPYHHLTEGPRIYDIEGDEREEDEEEEYLQQSQKYPSPVYMEVRRCVIAASSSTYGPSQASPMCYDQKTQNPEDAQAEEVGYDYMVANYPIY